MKDATPRNARPGSTGDVPPASVGMGATPVEPAGFEANRADALEPGTRLDIYEIERVIGASGFGFVYLAYDPDAQRRVAIKEYLPDTLAVRDEDGMQVLVRADSHIEAFDRGRDAFIEESQLLARLSHPSLLHVSRSWQSKGTAYRVMPYYPGNSLFMLREAMDAPPDEASLRALLDGLLGALEALHEAGVVHREVSPWNVLLLPDDTPILLDFNAARRAMVGDRARALMSLLTPTFAPIELTNPSPERPVGPWTDLHSLAEVVRYCISGELPKSPGMTGFRESMGALLRRLQGTWPRLQYSASFLTAIDAALLPNPQDRPQSVQALRQRLDDHPSAGTPVSVDESQIDRDVEPDEGLAPEAVLGEAQEAHEAPEHEEPPTQPGSFADEEPDEEAREEQNRQTLQPLMDLFRAATTPPAADAGGATRAKNPPMTFDAAASTRPREPQRPEPSFDAASREPEDRTASNQPFYSVLSPSPSSSSSLSSRFGDELDGFPAPEPQGFAARAEDRPAIFDFAERNRRARRRWTVVTTVLALAAIGGAAWWVDNERLASHVQSAFEQAIKRDVGVTAPPPAAPQDAAQAPPAIAPVNAASAAASQSSTAMPEAPRAVADAAPADTLPAAGVQQSPAATSTSGTETMAATAVSTGPAIAATSPTAPATAASVPPPLSSRAVSATPAVPPPAAVTPDFVAPAKTARAPAKGQSTKVQPAKAQPAKQPSVSGPREACGARTDFSLYRCMQTQCAQARWHQHPSCKRLRERDEVG